MRKLRKISQGFFLILFLFLFIETQSKGFDTLGYPVRIFLDFDPLILLTTFLAAHAVPRGMLWALTLAAVTLVMGRVFCGWVCPMGTLNNMVGAGRKRRGQLPVNLFRVKYYLLLALLAAAFFTWQAAGFVDPLSILIRAFTITVYPLFNLICAGVFNVGQGVPGMADSSLKAADLLRGTVLAFQQPYFLQSVFIGILFLGILLANLVEPRFWCRYLCPLGALLGLLARFSFLSIKVSEGCTQCGTCIDHCRAGAITDEGRGRRKSECLACFDCDDPCPAGVVGFGRAPQASPLNLGRRGVLASVAAGMLTVPFLRLSPPLANPVLIRPPGSLPEPDFLKRCVKCGECMKVCITNGLQPTLLEAGVQGIWTPRLVPRMGYCEYRCTLCGQVCPTGAIKQLSLQDKAQVKIGLAMIDISRCLPYAHATPCIACQEVCPTPKKAVWLTEARVKDRAGREIALKQPHVDLDLCIGCGICEKTCPVADRPAIYVTSIGESRSTDNQL